MNNKPKLTMNELFSGIGSQIQGFKNIGLFDVKVAVTSDIDKDAILSYAIIHCGLTKEYIKSRLEEDSIPFDKIAEWLIKKNIGYDFKKEKPYNWHKLTKTKKSQYDLMKYYLACVMSNNMGDISSIESLPYADLWTYSFPCQDISVAGLQEGIKEGTRSGLLLEVERLLEKAIQNNEPPKYLLLENVKNLVGGKHKENFDKWLNKLDGLGYNTYWKVVNAKNCGIPQNRERVFAISIRKDIDNKKYEFPNNIPLELRLKDLLDLEVDEKYYLNDEQLDRMNIDKINIKSNTQILDIAQSKREGKPREYAEYCPTLTARDWKDPKCVQVAELSGGKWDKIHESARRIYSEDGISPTIHTCQSGNIEPKVEQTICEQRKDEGLRFFKDDCVGTLRTIDSCGDKRVITNTSKIRKLIPKECWRLMGFKDDDFNKVESFGISNTQLYKQAGNSIVVDCIELLMQHLYKAQYDSVYICKDENFTIPHK